MDQISVNIEANEVRIFINSISLLSLIQSYEKPFAGTLAGQYNWLPSHNGAQYELSATTLDEDEKATLLECDCGTPGCWPLMAQIIIDENTVTWCNFEQPHRLEYAAAGHWNYDNFGSFVFQRSQYEKEIAKIV